MEGAVTLSPAAAARRRRALMAAGEIDAAFLMGDSATNEMMKKLRARARACTS